MQIYLWVSITILHFLCQCNETKRHPCVVLYTRIAQQMTPTKNVYIAAAAYLAAMLLSLLACFRR